MVTNRTLVDIRSTFWLRHLRSNHTLRLVTYVHELLPWLQMLGVSDHIKVEESLAATMESLSCLEGL